MFYNSVFEHLTTFFDVNQVKVYYFLSGPDRT